MSHSNDNNPIFHRSKRDSDALWYKHQPLDSTKLTTTIREQQEAILSGERPKHHGRQFETKYSSRIFDESTEMPQIHSFSAHDHRLTLPSNGYLGKIGLGKKNSVVIEKRLHTTKPDFLASYNYHNYHGNAYETSSGEAYQPYKPYPAPSYRRFPKLYGEPQSGPVELSNNLTKWHGSFIDYHPMYNKPSELVALERDSTLHRLPGKQWRYAYH